MTSTQAPLVTLTDPRSPASEAYRTLRTNLVFAGLENPLRTLVVTSPAPEEGKSTALANLAVTLAQSGKRTVIVDTDLRKPTQHEIWGVDRAPGLTSMVLDGGEAPLVDVGVPNLMLLPSGPPAPNPADLLASPQLEAAIESLAADHDFVLLDAPPVLAVTDAALLSAQQDGVLLVIRAGSTRRDHAERARQLLERLHVRIVGAVLTNAQADSIGDYYGA